MCPVSSKPSTVHCLLCVQDGQLRLLYRHNPGSTIHCFKGSCILPAPMEVGRMHSVHTRARCLQLCLHVGHTKASCLHASPHLGWWPACLPSLQDKPVWFTQQRMGCRFGVLAMQLGRCRMLVGSPRLGTIRGVSCADLSAWFGCVLVQQPLSMAREFDLVKTWNNYITNSPILKVC